MCLDADAWLLDRLFQPVVDALARRTTCFRLARACLLAAVSIQAAVLAWDLAAACSPNRLMLVAVATGAECIVARAAGARIGREEQSNRPGSRNAARITLRPFRLGWIAFTLLAVAAWLGSGLRAVDLGGVAACLLWVGTAYFMCCAQPTPGWRPLRAAPGLAPDLAPDFAAIGAR